MLINQSGILHRWGIFVLLMIFFQVLAQFFNFLMPFELTDTTGLMDQIKTISSSDRIHVRWIMILIHLCSFLLPAILFALIVFKSDWKKFLKINPVSDNKYWNYIPFLFLGSLPILGIMAWLNSLLPIPQHLIDIDNELQGLITSLLTMDSNFELFQCLILVAVVPAIGEEFLFRGVLQNKLLEVYDNPHVAILFGAIIFSAFHLQFAGFLPRFALGALFGYIYYYADSIWPAVALHFLNNAFMVLLVSFSPLGN